MTLSKPVEGTTPNVKRGVNPSDPFTSLKIGDLRIFPSSNLTFNAFEKPLIGMLYGLRSVMAPTDPKSLIGKFAISFAFFYRLFISLHFIVKTDVFSLDQLK